MPAPDIELTKLVTLKDFYTLMQATRDVRFAAVQCIFEGRAVPEDVAASLTNALNSLEAVPEQDGKRILSLDGQRTISLDMDYEINETRKDIHYLELGENSFLRMLDTMHENFDAHVAEGRKCIGSRHVNCFITDRDGTVNNYCGRYRSSVQSIYNAVMLTRFAKTKTDNAVILTSAPLADIGLVDISVAPERVMYYAGSKGRECLDLEGRVRTYPIEAEKQELLERLNTRLAALLAEPEYEKFSLIGSGLQFKFGQTTVARQDISTSVPPEESKAFLATLANLVEELDPAHEHLRIEDTGLDVEIILTIDTGESGTKDFDKGDGVNFLNTEFEFEMFHGPNLICGDTGSDVPMLEAAMAMNKDTLAAFVTRNDDLARRVRGICPNALIIPEPDMLVTILGTLP
ncbi:trehalose 6-phosphate synthase [Pseudodesulfovibrio senegalensis]|uniref:Trehalose 6-phosphate synthase n=1 Tax=Pseudodesulfovibrio senegalensis TaxID=1721087 RepID=A0A6N6N338_9BACT|nr:trehalose 6-phosphate synthase [Pseudodesulfovibrio senegalensis]KAB1442223.1 trehalose 6-phosphate synthase [Pseudodesulfovibrio senegalensis]